MTHMPGFPHVAVPVVGPAETWTPDRLPGSTQDPGGRGEAPHTPCPPGTNDVSWRTSPYDAAHVHAFRPFDGGVAEALCTHSVPAAQVSEEDDSAAKCVACLLILGDQLADVHGDRDRYQM
jgi:hypothetical protein